jgi:MYXO-CTERM domain-containing protein
VDVAAVLVCPVRASAFCGFFVSGADGSLYANATMVVLMRSGTTTVLSMQNNYQGPPEDFALVIPVPAILGEENVKTLPNDVFSRVDALAAPRLVEYWEQDPCYAPEGWEEEGAPPPPQAVMSASGGEAYGVSVEAEFAVGEYDVVILSAEDSSGLDRWLRHERYNIPAGAEPVLRPYVEQGTKFFVAKVDVGRVRRVNGQVLLSPLRFHYDSQDFWLPVRLGLLNSAGEQDLIVHVLAPNTRYAVANYPNALIPTNIVVADEVRRSYPAFYEALFRETIAQNPGAVVTEYSRAAGSCDPCPTPPLDSATVQLLGNDVVQSNEYELVLTRLHYRYDRDGLGQDLFFREAFPIVGGTGIPDPEGHLVQEPVRSSMNMFQGRYVILHPWEGAMSCSSPSRGQWGGPLEGGSPEVQAGQNAALLGVQTGAPPALAPLLASNVEGLGVRGTAPRPDMRARSGGCASCDTTSGDLPVAALALIVFVAAGMRRRG